MTNKQVILIIEDEKNIGNYIETIIISNGYKALRAMNGMSGLSLCLPPSGPDPSGSGTAGYRWQ